MFKFPGPLATPALLKNPTYSSEYGVPVKTFDKGKQIFVSFKTYGGSELNNNDLLTVENTGIVDTWFRPDITSASRLVINGKDYEVLGEPEDIDQRHQYLHFRVRQIAGGV